MPKDIIIDTTDPRTRQPKAAFLKTKKNHFEPMKLPNFETDIHLPNYISLDNPIIFFILYYIPEIIKEMILVTNLNFC